MASNTFINYSRTHEWVRKGKRKIVPIERLGFGKKNKIVSNQARLLSNKWGK